MSKTPNPLCSAANISRSLAETLTMNIDRFAAFSIGVCLTLIKSSNPQLMSTARCFAASRPRSSQAQRTRFGATDGALLLINVD